MVWRRIDLHIHTPGSGDYQEADIAYLDILRKAEARGADLIAFTDHNSVRGYANLWREIEDLELLEALERATPAEQRRLDEYRRILAKIRVLPGFEFTATFGFHILAIFPEGTAIRVLEHLLLELNVPEDKLDQGSGEVGATTDVLYAYEILHEAGALVVPAHVNSTHGVAMQNLPFGGQTKIAFTQSPYIDALEATDLESASRRSTARFFNGSKPEYPRRMHIIQGSDAHRLNRDPQRESNLGVCDRMTEVALPEVSFAALAELFRSDAFNRVRPYRPSQDPYDFVRSARAEGETIVQTFHERPPARRGRLSPVVRDVAAFANGNGGTVFVGLSANTADDVVGVPDAADQARMMLEDVERHIVPPLQVSADVHRTDGQQVIVLTVPAGGERPYVVAPGAIYVRQEGETAAALRDEIVQLVRLGMGVQDQTLSELAQPAFDPAPVTPAPQPEPRERRARGRRRVSAEVTPDPVQTVVDTDTSPIPEPGIDPQVQQETPSPLVPYPRTGVEIVESIERGGTTYHSMRDLRNLKVVHNVTHDSARRLWRYAITQKEAHPCETDQVRWIGDRGYWKSYKPRGGDVRYNLVYRQNGTMYVFYGVTDEGMDDAWREVAPLRGGSNGLVPADIEIDDDGPRPEDA